MPEHLERMLRKPLRSDRIETHKEQGGDERNEGNLSEDTGKTASRFHWSQSVCGSTVLAQRSRQDASPSDL